MIGSAHTPNVNAVWAGTANHYRNADGDLQARQQRSHHPIDLQWAGHIIMKRIWILLGILDLNGRKTVVILYCFKLFTDTK
jgi:hypothetical protein